MRAKEVGMRAALVMTLGIVCTLAGCGDDGGVTSSDGGELFPGDAGRPSSGAATASGCDSSDDCAGGTCLGAPGEPEEYNPRFVGGYCTTLGCVEGSQEGCGPDEWCIDGGGLGTFCVALCSKADGLDCARDDHVCLGLGFFGGCFSEQTIECNAETHEGCAADEVCVWIGFEDHTLGRCEPACDPMAQDCPASNNACYYIRRYNAAFCSIPGETPPDEVCMCDKCCTEGYACTPDPDGAGKHCKAYCVVTDGCAGGECVPLEPVSPWGGCVLPGSPGT